MNKMRNRYMSKARARAWASEDRKDFERELAKTPYYLEPWQRMPVDPTIEHVVTIEIEGEQYQRHRVRCTCGLDRGQQGPADARQDASYHADKVCRTKAKHKLDDLPVPLIERKQVPGDFVFRARCCCHFTGEWLTSEAVAALSSTLHQQECECRNRPVNELQAACNEATKRHYGDW